MSFFPHVTLRMNKSGITHTVVIDGNAINGVTCADVQVRPGELTKLVLELGVGSIETVLDEESK